MNCDDDKWLIDFGRVLMAVGKTSTRARVTAIFFFSPREKKAECRDSNWLDGWIKLCRTSSADTEIQPQIHQSVSQLRTKKIQTVFLFYARAPTLLYLNSDKVPLYTKLRLNWRKIKSTKKKKPNETNTHTHRTTDQSPISNDLLIFNLCIFRAHKQSAQHPIVGLLQIRLERDVNGAQQVYSWKSPGKKVN